MATSVLAIERNDAGDEPQDVNDVGKPSIAIVSFVALVIIVLLALVLPLNCPAGARELLMLTFIVLVPGWAVTVHWKSLEGPPLAVATVGGSMALLTLAATAVLWLHWWGPTALFVVEAAVSGVSITVGLLHRRGELRIRDVVGVISPHVRQLWNWPPRIPDLLIICSVALYVVAVSHVNLSRIDQWGLIPALPLTFYLALGILIVSTIWLLAAETLSNLRLLIHLVVLVIIIAGTTAIVYPAPRFPWLYKHIGVVQYINLHGAVNQSIDIYQNWPGFFALAAWFDRVVSISSPIRFAAWSETVVMLVSCLAIYAASRALDLTDRERWIGLFFFVAASWVDQIYFSPQALDYILSLSVLALVVSWSVRPGSANWLRTAGAKWRQHFPTFPRPTVAEGRTAGTSPDMTESLSDLSKFGAMGTPGLLVILGMFAILVFVHQLSPYVVALQVTVLTVFGRVRPRWLPAVLWTLAIAYLVPKFTFINDNYGLIKSIGSFTSNLQTKATGIHRPYDLGVRFSARAADGITLTVWLLAVIGVVRRIKAGRPTLIIAALAFAPVITFFMTNYGGEATYRVYFFSIPWIAMLAASAVIPKRRGQRRSSMIPFGLILTLLIAMMLPAYYGDDEVYVTRPGEIAAANFFYDHARQGSALILAAPDFPSRVSGLYDRDITLKNEVDPNLLDYPQFGYRILNKSDLPILSDLMETFSHHGRVDAYLVFTASGFAAAKAYNLAPDGALQGLEAAIRQSDQWSVWYQDSSTVIFKFHSKPGD